MPSNKDRLYVALYARGGKVKMPGLEDRLDSNPSSSLPFKPDF